MPSSNAQCLLLQLRQACNSQKRSLPSCPGSICAGSIPYAGRLPPLGSQRATLLASRAATSDTGTDSEAEPLAGAGGSSAAAAAAAAEPACYVIGGLGARGLVYHAWLGRLVAAAVLAGSDEGLPPELLRWKQT